MEICPEYGLKKKRTLRTTLSCIASSTQSDSNSQWSREARCCANLSSEKRTVARSSKLQRSLMRLSLVSLRALFPDERMRCYMKACRSRSETKKRVCIGKLPVLRNTQQIAAASLASYLVCVTSQEK